MENFCDECGTIIPYPGRGRPRRFCQLCSYERRAEQDRERHKMKPNPKCRRHLDPRTRSETKKVGGASKATQGARPSPTTPTTTVRGGAQSRGRLQSSRALPRLDDDAADKTPTAPLPASPPDGESSHPIPPSCPDCGTEALVIWRRGRRYAHLEAACPGCGLRQWVIGPPAPVVPPVRYHDMTGTNPELRGIHQVDVDELVGPGSHRDLLS